MADIVRMEEGDSESLFSEGQDDQSEFEEDEEMADIKALVGTRSFFKKFRPRKRCVRKRVRNC